MPDGTSRATGIASVQRTGSIRRNSSSINGIDESKNPSGSSANENAVRQAMTTEIFSVKPDDFVFEAVRLMGDKQVRRIPVITENGQLAGIISMADVALETEDELEIAETLEEISSGSGFWTKK